MSEDDVLFGYRLQLLDYAARTSVSEACRTFGVHRSTYYRWKRQVDRHGLEVLRPRAPQAEDAESAARDGRGADRRLRDRASWPGTEAGRIRASAREVGRDRRLRHSVWRCLRRHGLNTRHKRLSLVAGYRSPYEPPREPAPEPHIEVSRTGELVGFDCFFVGRLKGTQGAVWQLTAIDCYSSFSWAELVVCREGNPSAKQTSKLARRVARELKAAGWRLERVLCDNGNEFRGPLFHATLEQLGTRVTHIHSGRPQTNGHVEALHKTILEECWRPAFARYLYPRFTGLRRELERYLAFYNYDRVHHGRLTDGRIPADVVYGARKMEAR